MRLQLTKTRRETMWLSPYSVPARRVLAAEAGRSTLVIHHEKNTAIDKYIDI